MPNWIIKHPTEYGKKKSAKKKSTVRKLKKDVAELKRKARAERGTIDTDVSAGVSSSWSHFSNVFVCGQGDDLADRDGDNIIAQSLHLQGTFVSSDETNCLRIVAVSLDSAEDASIANIMATTTSSVSDPYSAFSSLYKLDGDCKYRKLADKRYKVNKDENFKEINFKIKIPKPNSLMKYITNSSDYPRTNYVMIMVVSDSLVESHPTLSLKIRQKYAK